MIFTASWRQVLPAALLLSGCAVFSTRQKPSILPPYIQKIAIHPFVNHTQQYGLEDKLTLAVQTEFNRDGRYQITTEDHADGIVSGDITLYRLEPLSYDTNHVPTEYKLTIPVSVTFQDKVKNQTLWTEPNMVGELRFFAATSGLAGAMTETDAQQSIWDQLSRDIRTRTFEGFGSSGGAAGSSKLNSNGDKSDSLPPLDNNPPPMPDQNPPNPTPTGLPY